MKKKIHENRQSISNYRIPILTVILLICHTPRLWSDTLIISKKDTLIYLIPITDLTNATKTTDSNPIASFVESRENKTMVNKWLKSLILYKKKSESTPTYDLSQAESMKKFDNMIIGNIIIKRLPPFGPSVRDTVSFPVSWIGKTGNHLRVPTAKRVIANILTFKSGDRFNSKELPENERILRNLDWINDALITVSPSKSVPGLIDIEIITQDKYPHAISVDLDAKLPELSIYTRNFMGRGIFFNHTISPRSESPTPGHEENLKFNNMGGSRIDLEINYIDNNNRRLIETQLDRNFYVTSHKYGGGLYYNRSIKNSPSQSLNQFNWPEEMNYYFSSAWVGRRFNLKTNNFLQNSNFYLTLQHISSRFYDLPDTLSAHPMLILNNHYYGSLSFGKRDYFKNNLVYSFGKTEDIPFGFLASMTIGINHNSSATRPYFGFKYSMGHAVIPNLGYLYMSAGWENYFTNEGIEQGALAGNIKYITPLIKINTSSIRTFAEVRYVKGINRFAEETLFINQRNYGITLFSNNNVRGNEKLTATIENVTFTPGTFWGFRMAYFTFADIAFINVHSKKLLSANNSFGCVGLGIKIKNERLVFKTIELRLGYVMGKPYPSPFEFRFSSESQKQFDEFIPSSPKFNIYK